MDTQFIFVPSPARCHARDDKKAFQLSVVTIWLDVLRSLTRAQKRMQHVRTREAGMDAHLGKPYTREQLQQLVSAWL